MVECAPWADSSQIKKVTRDWHFVNEPVITSESDRSLADEFLKQPQDMNITRVLPELFEIVAGSEKHNTAREVLKQVHFDDEYRRLDELSGEVQQI